MICAAVFPGRYVQGPGALQLLGQETERLGRKGFFLCSRSAFDRIMPALRRELGACVGAVERFGGESTLAEMRRVAGLAAGSGCDFIAGLGGGKTLDTAKAAAHELKVPVAVVPTIASTDAPCSAVSVFYTPEGLFDHYIVMPRNPDLVLVDTGVIVKAPVRFLVSGMGDALATWFEADSCRQSGAPNTTGHAAPRAAQALARLCYDILLEHGAAAKRDGEAGTVTPAFEAVVEANTLLSGLGFESGGLAAAHSVHNGLTVLPQARRFFHGEKVAFGTLTSLFLTGKPAPVVDEVYGFCGSVGLPTRLQDLGLAGAGDEDLRRAARRACAPSEDIRHEPVPVTPEAVFDAMKAVDAEGCRSKPS